MAAKNYQLAEAVAEAVYKVDPEIILFGLAGSESIKAAGQIGLRAASEVFSDRTYQQDGSLTSRREENALIKDSAIAIEQVVRMVKEGRVSTVQGEDIPIQAHTVCIHGDGETALEFAQQISGELHRNGIKISKISDFI